VLKSPKVILVGFICDDDMASIDMDAAKSVTLLANPADCAEDKNDTVRALIGEKYAPDTAGIEKDPPKTTDGITEAEDVAWQ
tara:strand:+ start:5523 stop:5768 length:246 start_codon:yes stop_codon:yes gene_type:complete